VTLHLLIHSQVEVSVVIANVGVQILAILILSSMNPDLRMN